MTGDIETRMQQIAGVITQLDDPKVPRNIRKGAKDAVENWLLNKNKDCLLYTSPSPRDATLSRMPSSA